MVQVREELWKVLIEMIDCESESEHEKVTCKQASSLLPTWWERVRPGTRRRQCSSVEKVDGHSQRDHRRHTESARDRKANNGGLKTDLKDVLSSAGSAWSAMGGLAQLMSKNE
jgi:hypothetical protein